MTDDLLYRHDVDTSWRAIGQSGSVAARRVRAVVLGDRPHGPDPAPHPGRDD